MEDSPAPKGRSSKKGKRVFGNLTKKDADSWIKRMGNEVGGKEGNVLGHPKKRHYEAVPDDDNPGKFVLIFVEDE